MSVAFSNDYSTLQEATRRFLAAPPRMLIDGRWVEAAGGATLPVTDPSSGAVVAHVPAAQPADVDRAVRAARAAFDSGDWSRTKPAEREKLLWRLADLMERDAQLLAELDCVDNGKPLAGALAVDVPLSIDLVRYMAGAATRIQGKTVNASVSLAPQQRFFAYTLREPVGVVAAIIPWNFPLLMAAVKVAPTLAAGCSVVLKPAEDTPLSALHLAQLAVEAGFPAGALNVVSGMGEVAGAALVRHPAVDKVSFTGSTEVGRQIGRTAVDTMKRLTLELGGKSPVVVLQDADLDAVIPCAAEAIFSNAGQDCTAGSRLLVHESRFDAVVSGVVEAARSLRIGPGLDPETQLGPVVSARQQQRVLSYIESGRSESAKVLCGGARVDRPGFFVQPTVLADVRSDMRVVREEIFGPVLVVQPFRTLEEAAHLANDTPYGLGASIWSRDLAAVHELVGRVRAGTVWVNTHGALDPAMTFGGVKQSGFGKDLGDEVLLHCTELKSVIMRVA